MIRSSCRAGEGGQGSLRHPQQGNNLRPGSRKGSSSWSPPPTPLPQLPAPAIQRSRGGGTNGYTGRGTPGLLAALEASRGGLWTIDLIVTCEKGQRVGTGDQRLAKLGVLVLAAHCKHTGAQMSLVWGKPIVQLGGLGSQNSGFGNREKAIN